MMNKDVKGILALAVVTALSFGVIFGTGKLTRDEGAAEGETEGTVKAELDTSGAENIEKAVQMEDGSYVVSVKAAGYGGDIRMDVTFDGNGSTIRSLAVTEQSETENLGARITEDEFLSQFSGIQAPVYLPGMTLETEGQESEETADGEESQTGDPLDGAVYTDGSYEAKAEAPDDNGFVEQVTMTVENGKITEMNWDCVKEDGTRKSELAENGEYVMTEDGLNWAEQSRALTDAMIENQSLGFLTMDEQTKTDAVAGVSISVGGFEKLARQCMEEAAGISAPVTLADGSYEAQAASADDNGFVEQVTMTVENGKITEMNWDCVKEDGTRKSELAENGEYVMTEDGLNWAEQSRALTDAVIENQSLGFLTMDEQTKTDAVAGVSISVGGFYQLAQECIGQASGQENGGDAQTDGQETGENAQASEESGEGSQAGTQIDAVSGATISSTAVATGINEAYHYLQSAM